ncbi:protein of unknown function [Rhodovastum atsumiense]|nr:protein of unknown function [Rhodovastum atsumiense]
MPMYTGDLLNIAKDYKINFRFLFALAAPFGRLLEANCHLAKFGALRLCSWRSTYSPGAVWWSISSISSKITELHSIGYLTL